MVVVLRPEKGPPNPLAYWGASAISSPINALKPLLIIMIAPRSYGDGKRDYCGGEKGQL